MGVIGRARTPDQALVFPAHHGRAGLRRIARRRSPSQAFAASATTAEKLRRV